MVPWINHLGFHFGPQCDRPMLSELHFHLSNSSSTFYLYFPYSFYLDYKPNNIIIENIIFFISCIYFDNIP